MFRGQETLSPKIRISPTSPQRAPNLHSETLPRHFCRVVPGLSRPKKRSRGGGHRRRLIKVQHSFYRGLGLLTRCVGQPPAHFFTAQSAQVISLPSLIPQNLTPCLQHRVAGAMPMPVINRLEIIQIRVHNDPGTYPRCGGFLPSYGSGSRTATQGNAGGPISAIIRDCPDSRNDLSLLFGVD